MSLIEKYNHINTRAKASIWFAVTSIMQKGVAFITVPIFTRLLTAEEYGIYNVYLSWLQIFTIITSLYLYHGVFNNGMTKYDNDRDVYISSMQGLTLSITVLVSIVYYFNYNYWSELLGLSPIMIALMFVEMAVTPAFFFWSGRQRFENKYRLLVALTVAKSIINPVLGLIMVFVSENKALARVESVVITELAFCGILMIYQFKKGKHFFVAKYWKYALTLAIPLIPHYLSGVILNQGDKIMIDHMVGKSEVAYYSVAYSIGMLVQIITRAINNTLTPWLYTKIKETKYNDIIMPVNYVLVITFVISVLLMMVSPELISFFGPKSYESAAYVVPPVAASVFFIFLYNLLALPEFYFEKTRFLAVSSIIAAIVNILLNYVFIKEYGYIAAGYTTLACYVLYSIGHAIVSRKVLIKEIGISFIYDKNCIIVLSLIVIFLGITSNLLFNYWIIRYSVIVIAILICFLNRNRIKNLLS